MSSTQAITQLLHQRVIVRSDEVRSYAVEDLGSHTGLLILSIAVAPTTRWNPPAAGRLGELELEAMSLAGRLMSASVGREERQRLEARLVELDGLRQVLTEQQNAPRSDFGSLQLSTGTEVRFTGDLVALMDDYGKGLRLAQPIAIERHQGAVRFQLQAFAWHPIRVPPDAPIDVPPVVEVVLGLAIKQL